MAQFEVPMKRGERLLLEGQFRAAQKRALRDETEQRIRDHGRRVRRSGAAAKFRAAAQRSLDFLAVGDSWFDYPLDDSGWPSLYDHSIIGEYNLQSMGNPNPIILSFAHYGWASTQVLTYENQDQIIENIQGGSWTNGSGPDAILASFGGDDIAGDQLAIYLTYGGQSNAPSARFQGVLDSVQASYQDLFALRDIYAPNVPVFGQCYDYAIPDGVAANAFFGPWLKPSFDFALYEGAVAATQVVHDMIDQFYQMLNGLASNPAYNFHVVDTRGTITPNDWANELHPMSDGFNKLAQKLLAALQAYFPGQI